MKFCFVLLWLCILYSEGATQQLGPRERLFIPCSQEIASGWSHLVSSILPNVAFRVTADGLECEGTPSELEQLGELGFGQGSQASRDRFLQVLEAFQKADRIALFSLTYGREYHVTGSIWLSGQELRQIVDLVRRDHDQGITRMMCFDPHHGLFLESGGHRYRLLICYICGAVEASIDEEGCMQCFAGSSEPRLNEALKLAKPLP